jgi:hypothetical protein
MQDFSKGSYRTYLIDPELRWAYPASTRIVHSETDPRLRAGAGILTELSTCPPLFPVTSIRFVRLSILINHDLKQPRFQANSIPNNFLKNSDRGLFSPTRLRGCSFVNACFLECAERSNIRRTGDIQERSLNGSSRAKSCTCKSPIIGAWKGDARRA